MWGSSPLVYLFNISPPEAGGKGLSHTVTCQQLSGLLWGQVTAVGRVSVAAHVAARGSGETLGGPPEATATDPTGDGGLVGEENLILVRKGDHGLVRAYGTNLHSTKALVWCVWSVQLPLGGFTRTGCGWLVWQAAPVSLNHSLNMARPESEVKSLVPLSQLSHIRSNTVGCPGPDPWGRSSEQH